MKDTTDNTPGTGYLFNKAKDRLLEDMKDKEIGAIIWDNASAGFHFIPEIVYTVPGSEETMTVRVTGLYRYEATLYLIIEDVADISISDFYNEGTEVAPVVVTLSESVAKKDLGDPAKEKGFTTQGTLEEWLAIADCYFEALNEK